MKNSFFKLQVETKKILNGETVVWKLLISYIASTNIYCTELIYPCNIPEIQSTIAWRARPFILEFLQDSILLFVLFAYAEWGVGVY